MDKKLLSKSEKRVAIKAELLLGANSKRLSDSYGIPYATVVKYRTEQREGVGHSDILDLARTDAPLLQAVADGVKTKSAEVLPSATAAVFSGKVDELVSSVTMLHMLENSFHETITKLLSWANLQIRDDMDIKEWVIITDRIGELHTAIFANKGVQVNVQQNNSAGGFKQSMVN